MILKVATGPQGAVLELGYFPGLAASILEWLPKPRCPRLLGDRLMFSPRISGRDLSLERLGDRSGLRRAHLGEAAQVRTLEVLARSVERFSAAYQARIDAAFAGPGAAEWLAGLRRRVAAILTGQDAERPQAVPNDAICVQRTMR
jgi:hypothetical protein